MSHSWLNPMGLPGMGTPNVSLETVITWGSPGWLLLKPIQLDAATVDARNTPTTGLLPGLVLGKLTATDEWIQYSAAAADGSQTAEGVLMWPVNMLDPLSGSASNKLGVMLCAGPVKAAQLGGLDVNARGQMANRFIFDDDLAGVLGGGGSGARVVAKATDYVVLAADNGTIFTTRGAAGNVNFTLPAIARGLRFRFFSEAAGTMTVTAAAVDTMVVFNNLIGNAIAFSTAAEIIGGGLEVVANDNATKWLVFVNLGSETQTPVITA